jgi:quercetin dioxygenase-like cupin family protein
MPRNIYHAALLVLLVTSVSASASEPTPPVTVTPVARTGQTIAGQAIQLPQKDVEVVVSTYEIAPGAVLPEHKHRYPRYAYVLAGTLIVTNLDSGQKLTFKPGDFIVESLDSWHKGASTGSETVKLLVIDQIEKGAETVTLRPK